MSSARLARSRLFDRATFSGLHPEALAGPNDSRQLRRVFLVLFESQPDRPCWDPRKGLGLSSHDKRSGLQQTQGELPARTWEQGKCASFRAVTQTDPKSSPRKNFGITSDKRLELSRPRRPSGASEAAAWWRHGAVLRPAARWRARSDTSRVERCDTVKEKDPGEARGPRVKSYQPWDLNSQGVATGGEGPLRLPFRPRPTAQVPAFAPTYCAGVGLRLLVGEILTCRRARSGFSSGVGFAQPRARDGRALYTGSK